MPLSEVQSLHEDRLLVEVAGALGVLEDHDPVAVLAFVFRQQDAGIWLAGRVAVGFGDPEPAAVVEAEGDRLLHVRLAGEE